MISAYQSSNPSHGDMYSKQHYVIKFIGDLRLVGFFSGTPVSSTNKTDRHDITEILLKVVLNTITLTLSLRFYIFIYIRQIVPVRFLNDFNCSKWQYHVTIHNLLFVLFDLRLNQVGSILAFKHYIVGSIWGWQVIFCQYH